MIIWSYEPHMINDTTQMNLRWIWISGSYCPSFRICVAHLTRSAFQWKHTMVAPTKSRKVTNAKSSILVTQKKIAKRTLKGLEKDCRKSRGISGYQNRQFHLFEVRERCCSWDSSWEIEGRSDNKYVYTVHYTVLYIYILYIYIFDIHMCHHPVWPQKC